MSKIYNDFEKQKKKGNSKQLKTPNEISFSRKKNNKDSAITPDMIFVDDVLTKMTLAHFRDQDASSLETDERKRLVSILDKIAMKKNINKTEYEMFIKSLHALAFAKDAYFLRYQIVRNEELVNVYNNTYGLLKEIVYANINEELPFT